MMGTGVERTSTSPSGRTRTSSRFTNVATVTYAQEEEEGSVPEQDERRVAGPEEPETQDREAPEEAGAGEEHELHREALTLAEPDAHGDRLAAGCAVALESDLVEELDLEPVRGRRREDEDDVSRRDHERTAS